MTFEQSTTELQPPDTLQDALEVLRAWERGETTLSPDGIAVARFLQNAQINRVGALATAGKIEV